jgi:hypothetical protein
MKSQVVFYVPTGSREIMQGVAYFNWLFWLSLGINPVFHSKKV